ncbi:undecaprenyldiphospho-muramoylpentapeptide beta-N-acetylglucosaminyltransferase [Marinomonas algarum]|uniref:UDP-N-acetylglucosamine--N-acetylmuramyl-(pentapeptide) pyrophosphoryl-undecaprenol N-acetylglucosamine transferase n=1 Tax=Marinomonas algarum TaxID=2883105 RepID=A0A9X1LBY6_9GAMM|nr:undecaprenyldiphospho-muramoylpentapeptide beta-N-acetylglucosaminyltransferase [Marinomonas algarum]MCB5161414.1 undecaprenyldiphospho-muramoylpentapeptide beta-N-acetylglucosaminyltransferase [Marinomonas algarum]
MNKAHKIMIMAGGTGGHIYPALACAQLFKEKGHTVHWLGSKGGMEETLVPKHDIPLHALSIKGVRGKGLAGLLAAPFRIMRAIGQALAILKKERPSVVLGMGGFVAGPGGVAAKLLGIPLVIHEQNAVAGTTNRLLSKIATTVLQAFDGALKGGITVGNPVRNSILTQLARLPREGMAKPIRLLVVGGSLGAKAINDIMPEVIANWPSSQRLDVWHQTGVRNFEEVIANYQSARAEARVDAYLDDIDKAYYWADIVLCRAGAMTVSELAIAGLPSILVPYPHAIDDHQTANACHLERAGAALLLPQPGLSSQKVISSLVHLIDHDGALLKMGKQASKKARPDATLDVVKHCLRLITS